MSELSGEQLNALSANYSAMGLAIAEYRENNQLSDADDQKLGGYQDQILDYSTRLSELSAVQIGDEASASLSQLKDITTQIQETIKTLKNVQHIIDIAAGVVKVAGAIVSLKPGEIVSAIGDLSKTCNIGLAPSS